MFLACPSRPFAFVLLLAACSSNPGDTSTETTAPTTTAPPTTDATTTDATTTDATTTDATTSDTTTDGLVCDLVEITTERAHANGGDVLDCGIVDPWNSTV